MDDARTLVHRKKWGCLGRTKGEKEDWSPGYLLLVPTGTWSSLQYRITYCMWCVSWHRSPFTRRDEEDEAKGAVVQDPGCPWLFLWTHTAEEVTTGAHFKRRKEWPSTWFFWPFPCPSCSASCICCLPVSASCGVESFTKRIRHAMHVTWETSWEREREETFMASAVDERRKRTREFPFYCSF